MLRTAFARIGLALTTAAATACASAPAPAATDGVTPAATPRRDRTVITAEDLKEVTAQNLFEVVQRLHPEWLVARNQGTVSGRAPNTASGQSGVQVYMDLQRLGNVEMLRQLNVSTAASLKFYSASDAQARFGNGNTSGAIQIISIAGKR